jgi:hypothetical protein
VLESNNQEQLIFKHAISTVAMGRSSHSQMERPVAAAAATDPVPVVASGTDG